MRLFIDGCEIECTPEEYAQLKKLDALPNSRGRKDGASVGSDTSNGHVGKHNQRITEDGTDGAASQRQQSINTIDTERFFRKPTRSMARIMLAYINHEGAISLSQLLAETGASSGSSLRKPNGALSERIRTASLDRIREFHTAQEARNEVNGHTERIYRIDPEVLEFLRANEARIINLANMEG
jgi:hypothetical protein